MHQEVREGGGCGPSQSPRFPECQGHRDQEKLHSLVFNLFFKVEQSLFSCKTCKENQNEKVIKAVEMGHRGGEGGGILTCSVPHLQHTYMCTDTCTHRHKHCQGNVIFKKSPPDPEILSTVIYYQVSIKPECDACHRPSAR